MVRVNWVDWWMLPAVGRNGLRVGRASEAEALAAMVRVVLMALPAGVMLEGEKEQVAPVGRPEP